MAKRLYESRLHTYKNNRDRVLRGLINCIPNPFTRFKRELPGTEKSKYYLVTGSTKSAKSQFTDFFFFLWVLQYAYFNPSQLKVKIFYFSLEMSIQEKFDQFTCYWLYMYSQGKIRIDTKQLNSLDPDNPVSEEVLKILEGKDYQNFFDFVEDHVVFDEHNRNPYGIYKTMRDYSLANGTVTYKEIDWVDADTGITSKRNVVDYYTENDPEEYKIGIIDHYGLITPEKGMTLRDSIGKLSSSDIVYLRNTYKWTIVGIQQQAADKEGNESFKLNRLTPSQDGLADNKATARDCNVMIGIFSPFRYEKAEWKGYDISEFRDNIRFVEVVLNRNGGSGMICPVYFDGAVNYFSELPLPNDVNNLSMFKTMAKQAQGRVA